MSVRHPEATQLVGFLGFKSLETAGKVFGVLKGRSSYFGVRVTVAWSTDSAGTISPPSTTSKACIATSPLRPLPLVPPPPPPQGGPSPGSTPHTPTPLPMAAAPPPAVPAEDVVVEVENAGAQTSPGLGTENEGTQTSPGLGTENEGTQTSPGFGTQTAFTQCSPSPAAGSSKEGGKKKKKKRRTKRQGEKKKKRRRVEIKEEEASERGTLILSPTEAARSPTMSEDSGAPTVLETPEVRERLEVKKELLEKEAEVRGLKEEVDKEELKKEEMQKEESS